MDKLEESFKRIERVWQEVAPASLRALRKPANKRAGALLAKVFPEPPRELEALYALHDGMADREPFVNGGTLLSVTEAAELYRVHADELDGPKCELTTDPRIRNEARWRARWWPLVDADGDHFVFDADPGPGGDVGQIVTFENSYARPRIVVARSIVAWLEAYADCLEQGQFGVEDMGIWVSAFQG
ncbi:MAG: hypothetical protein U0271_16460 [Polyangiaceae bacterium]